MGLLDDLSRFVITSMPCFPDNSSEFTRDLPEAMATIAFFPDGRLDVL